jgi:hypothetical protein
MFIELLVAAGNGMQYEMNREDQGVVLKMAVT